MSKDNEDVSSKVGIIPDFFHDIIAYIIPGYTAIVLFCGDLCVIGLAKVSIIKQIDIKDISLAMLVAYVIGRFYEQLGLMTIHRKKFPYFFKSSDIPSPKWFLIFDPNNKRYTNSFKDNVENKIREWLQQQDGANLIEACKSQVKDDYFNIIQFYLRERFPSVAFYEKKQNATIVLTRSLSLIFAFNIVIYVIILPTVQKIDLTFSFAAIYWIILNIFVSFIMYKRFQQDKIYHAMYIFETFIAMKKLLKRRSANNNTQ